MDEFTYLADNAEQAGVSGPLPAVSRVERGDISALRWGTDPVRVVFLHGGGQNAHTWDTVILGLGVPALAIDLPGHGRSAWRDDGDYGPKLNSAAVEPVVLQDAAPKGLIWRFQSLPDETHGTVFHPAALRAFRALFAPEPR